MVLPMLFLRDPLGLNLLLLLLGPSRMLNSRLGMEWVCYPWHYREKIVPALPNWKFWNWDDYCLCSRPVKIVDWPIAQRDETHTNFLLPPSTFRA